MVSVNEGGVLCRHTCSNNQSQFFQIQTFFGPSQPFARIDQQLDRGHVEDERTTRDNGHSFTAGHCCLRHSLPT